MNKRLRKKLHKGEFQQLGFEVNWKFKSGIDIDEEFDNFIEFLESLKCGTSGFYSEEICDQFIRCGRKGTAEQAKNKIEEWLRNNKEIDQLVIGSLKDIWYGKF